MTRNQRRRSKILHRRKMAFANEFYRFSFESEWQFYTWLWNQFDAPH